MGAGVRIITGNEDETAELAVRLADTLAPGDTVLLAGPVGAGKSVFARAIVQHLLGSSEDVPSPTFTLVQRYKVGERSLVHADLYRLQNSLELEETGILDEPEGTILLIEWPELLPGWMSDQALTVTIGLDGQRRIIDLSSAAPRWTSRLSELADGS